MMDAVLRGERPWAVDAVGRGQLALEARDAK